jgi:hypothetical protein
MRNAIAILFVCLPALAQIPVGQWISDTRWLDRHNWQRMVLTLNGKRLTGKYGDVDFDGTFRNGSIEATVRRGDSVTELHGRLEGAASPPNPSSENSWPRAPSALSPPTTSP